MGSMLRPRQLALALDHAESFAREDFLAGPSNETALALIESWPDWPNRAVVLVGKTIGLHPVWLMFALLAFGYLFGFVGLLVAVPVAAAIGVLVRFAISQYLASPLYTGDG